MIRFNDGGTATWSALVEYDINPSFHRTLLESNEQIIRDVAAYVERTAIISAALMSTQDVREYQDRLNDYIKDQLDSGWYETTVTKRYTVIARYEDGRPKRRPMSNYVTYITITSIKDVKLKFE